VARIAAYPEPCSLDEPGWDRSTGALAAGLISSADIERTRRDKGLRAASRADFTGIFPKRP